MEKVQLGKLISELGVSDKVVEVLFDVFPESEFATYLDLFCDALKNPKNLKPFIFELQVQLNTGASSHTASAMFHFLEMESKFGFFTRDYVRRCCDMVEYITKRKVAGRLRLDSKFEKQPLGRVIGEFTVHYSRQFPEGLLEALAKFNEAIYCPAKHEAVNKEEKRKYSIADAIAITFIAVRLCQRLDDFQRKYWG